MGNSTRSYAKRIFVVIILLLAVLLSSCVIQKEQPRSKTTYSKPTYTYDLDDVEAMGHVTLDNINLFLDGEKDLQYMYYYMKVSYESMRELQSNYKLAFSQSEILTSISRDISVLYLMFSNEYKGEAPSANKDDFIELVKLHRNNLIEHLTDLENSKK